MKFTHPALPYFCAQGAESSHIWRLLYWSYFPMTAAFAPLSLMNLLQDLCHTTHYLLSCCHPGTGTLYVLY